MTLTPQLGPDSGSHHVARVPASVRCHRCQSLHHLCQLHKRPQNVCLLPSTSFYEAETAREAKWARGPSRNHVPWEGEWLSPGLGSQSHSALLSACVCSLKYSRTTCYVFGLKGQKRSSPFKIIIPLLFVSFWNTIRTGWGHDSELSTLPTQLP